MPRDSLGGFQQQNRQAWDRLVEQRSRFAKVADDDELLNPLRTVDGRLGWLAHGVAGLDLLCLAAGGGRQSVLYAAAGANVTVVDISPRMLEIDRQVAAERRLSLRTIEASMDNLSMLGDATFDVVIQPVSTCYVPQIVPVFQEVARVTRPGGIYISQHKAPVSLQSDLEGQRGGYVVRQRYYRETEEALPPAATPSRLREEGTWEFIHRLEEIIGGMCRSGFVLEDLVEPNHAKADADEGGFAHRAQYIAPYLRIKARRVSGQSQSGQPESGNQKSVSRIVLPDE